MYKIIFLSLMLQLGCMAAPHSVEVQAAYLRAVLAEADEAYYNQYTSMMCDEAYDAMREQYSNLVRAYPDLGEAVTVGSPVPESGLAVEHQHPVLSLQKAYTDEALQAFVHDCGTGLLYCVEPKMDGLSLVLHYENGLLVQAASRGDGHKGSDVTKAIFASGAVPLKLAAKGHWEVRGELFMPLSAFSTLNQRRRERGEAPLKSPRNTAAGSLRLKDCAEIRRRGLAFCAFELMAADAMPPTHTEALARMQDAGVPVVENDRVTGSGVLAAVADLNKRRAAYPYPTDGVVIRVDGREAYKKLGATSHHPRGALARKYRQKPVLTRLLAVEWSRGKTGQMTPVARFEPVEIKGALVQKANLHTLAYIRALDLRIGDWIGVIRAGGAVPEIVNVYPDRRSGREALIEAPDFNN